MTQDLDPRRLMQIASGFMASKTLLSAVELKLFTSLGDGPLTGPQIAERIGLHPRALYDFLDTLVSLGVLLRDGEGPGARYQNGAEAARFLDARQPTYVGGILEMASRRLFAHWSHLTEALRTGQPQSEMKGGSNGFFETLYADEQRLEQFLAAMQANQLANFHALFEKLDFTGCHMLLDVGGANAALSIAGARRHPELHFKSFDLPAVLPVARRNIAQAGLLERIDLLAGNFFRDALPSADVITMGNVLHDWDETQKKALIAKAYAALPHGGRLIAIENVIDDARRTNTFGLLMSLTMLIEQAGGFDYTGAQFDAWCRGAGFVRTQIVPLAGAASAAIAYK
jgi:hypothetical protein